MRKSILSFCLFLAMFAAHTQPEAVHYATDCNFQRHATPEDRALLSETLSGLRSYSPPAPPVSAIAEFQPMGGVMVAYPLGVPVTLVRELSAVTKVKVIVSTANDSIRAKQYFNTSQVNMGNVDFWIVPHDSYWVRDYGPWFVIDGKDSVRIIDFIYNRPSRPKDDAAMEFVAEYLNMDRYEMPMVHTGGNYMADGYGTAASTMLVMQENPYESDSSLNSMAEDFLGIDNYMFLPDPLGEYIAHIDCWGKFLSVDKVLIAKVPESDPRYDNYESVAQTFEQSLTPWGNHYKVFRVNANPNASSATPYTNSLIINNHVFVPVTGNTLDNDAIEVYQNAMPGYTIVPIMQSPYRPWLSTDALHCRTHELADMGMLHISHRPLLESKTLAGDLSITATIKPLNGSPLVQDSVLVFYRINDGEWKCGDLVQQQDNIFSFDFSSLDLGGNDEIEYYIFAKDESGRTEKHPYIGAADPHRFVIEGAGIGSLNNFSVSVFPNPAEDILVVKTESHITQARIYDLQGRLVVKNDNIQGNICKFNVGFMPSGFYLIRISDNKGRQVIRKFAKN